MKAGDAKEVILDYKIMKERCRAYKTSELAQVPSTGMLRIDRPIFNRQFIIYNSTPPHI